MNKDELNWMNIKNGSNELQIELNKYSKLNWMNIETELDEYRNQIEPI